MSAPITSTHRSAFLHRVDAGRSSGFPVLGGDSERAEVFRSGPPSRNGSGPNSALLAGDISKRHAAPGLLVLLGAQGAAGAWAALKRSLPKARLLPHSNQSMAASVCTPLPAAGHAP